MTNQKVVVVTEGAGGIGRACCEKFASAGSRIVAVNTDPESLARLERDLPDRVGGAELLTVTADVADRNAMEEAVAAATERFRGMDTFVAAAAIGTLGPIDTVAPDEWDRIVDVTLKGSANGCRAVIPVMRSRGGGSIVLFGSVLGRNVLQGTGAYGAGKAASRGSCERSPSNYAADGIRVNCVVPGTIDTPMTWSSVRPEERETLMRYAAEDIPIGRIGRPEEVAACVKFLASPEASFVTGTSLLVERGHLGPDGIADMTARGETARYRLRQARDALRASEFDAFLLCGGANLNFLSGFPYVDVNLARPYFLVVSERDLTLLVHTGRFYEAERLSWVNDVQCYRRLSVAPIGELRHVLRDHGLTRGRLGMELGYEQRLGIPVAEVDRLRAELAPLTIGDAAALLWQLRIVKAHWDVAAIRTACGITAAAYAATLRGISPGQREIDVLVAMEETMRLGGGATPWVKITSGTGNYDVLLGPGTERILEPGDMVWMDGGCAVEGMWSDFGRAAVIGGPSWSSSTRSEPSGKSGNSASPWSPPESRCRRSRPPSTSR